MNAIENNRFSETWKKIGASLPNPRAVVCISAHWLTHGTHVTANKKPKTIHDFGGFPKELFAVQYPAPGSPEVAAEIKHALAGTSAVTLTEDWGLDHGTWSVLVHMHAAADIPVLQLSIDASASPDMFFKIGEKLRPLRDKGILFVGSGNIVHNLRLVDWARLNETGYAHEWAREANDLIVKLINAKDWQRLIDWKSLGKSAETAINSAEHYVPLLYILGLSHAAEKAEYFNAEAVGGALTMTSVRFG
jgi:4,5-DOPA dioxygenase extradiol